MSAYHGRGGSVAWTNMTHLNANVNSWTIDISGDEEEVTAFGSPTNSAPYPRQYIPGLTAWSGSYDARMDSVSGGSVSMSDVGTMDTLTLETGNVTYTGSAFITGFSPTIPVDGVATVTVTFRGKDAVTIS